MTGVRITPTITGHLETVLSVTFAESSVQAPPPSTTARTTPAPRSNVPRTSTPPAANDVTPAPAIASAAAPQHSEPGTNIDRRSQAARAQIRSRLLADLKRYFEYPLIARRRGWEGTVWLAFTVAPDGGLERIHVARGSGYDALDHAAIVALRRVDQMREASAWLNGRALDMELPVIYRLQEP